MKKVVFLPSLMLVFLLTSCAICGKGEQENCSGDLRIGWAKRSIAPPADTVTPISGQFYLRISLGNHTPVLASAVAIENVKTRDCVVLVSLDVVSIQPGVYNRVMAILRKELPDLPAEKVILNATHTHAGPSTIERTYDYPHHLKFSPPDTIPAFIARQTADAVKAAWLNRAPGAVAYGYGYATTGLSRRVLFRKDPGELFCRVYGKTARPDMDSFEAGTDPFVNFLFTFDKYGKITGTVINVPCPSQTGEGEWMLHASFWHNVREKLSARYGEEFCVVGQSAAGGDLSPHQLHYREAYDRRLKLKYPDLYKHYLENPMKNPIITPGTPEYSRHCEFNALERLRTEDIANRIITAFDDVLPWAAREKFASPILRHEVRTVELTRKTLPADLVEQAKVQHEKVMKEKFLHSDDVWKNLRHNSILATRQARLQRTMKQVEEVKKAPRMKTDIHVVRIGNIAFATNRFELFLDYQHRIQGRSPFEQTFIVQLTAESHGAGSYLPSRRAEDYGGYGAAIASNRVGHTGGQELVEETLKSLQKVKEYTGEK